MAKRFTVNEIKAMNNDDIIACIFYSFKDETKGGAKELVKLCAELEKRGVVSDADSLFDKSRCAD